MKDRLIIILRWAINIAFCIGLVVFFGKNCILRPAICSHIYKEYLSGIAVLFIIYINYLLLFPKFYKEAKYAQYILYTLASVVAAFLFEVSLFLPENKVIVMQLPHPDNILFMLTSLFFVLLRDLSFAAITFSVQAFIFYRKMSQNKDSLMLKEFHRIEVGTFGKRTEKILVTLEEITYCKQNKNFTKFFLVDGSNCFRYGSLKSLSELLDESYAVKVSRSIMVPYTNIISYNTSGVVVKSYPENIIISYSENCAAHAFKMISDHLREQNNFANSMTAPQKKTVQKNNNLNKKTHQREFLYAFINDHPGCSAADIKKNRSISQSTVNRILAQLKKEGLIEYVGSKKTGGYKATGNRQEGTGKRQQKHYPVEETFQETSLP